MKTAWTAPLTGLLAISPLISASAAGRAKIPLIPSTQARATAPAAVPSYSGRLAVTASPVLAAPLAESALAPAAADHPHTPADVYAAPLPNAFALPGGLAADAAEARADAGRALFDGGENEDAEVSNLPAGGMAAGGASRLLRRAGDALRRTVAAPLMLRAARALNIPAAGRAYLASLPSGESPMPGAPEIVSEKGSLGVPSQYLAFRHTVQSVQDVVSRIRYKDHVMVFVGKGKDGPYIQVGMVGPENYQPKGAAPVDKLVFARRWRVEKYLPTSELIQTVMLAIKKVEEHEVRELLRYKGNTIFSTHLDFPMLTTVLQEEAAAETYPLIASDEMREILASVRFDGLKVRPAGFMPGVVRVRFEADGMSSSHWNGRELTVLLRTQDKSGLLYGLMDAIVAESERDVEETFTFDGVARFSRKVTPDQLLAFNRLSRTGRSHVLPEGVTEKAFRADERVINVAIATTRPPKMPAGPANARAVEQFSALQAADAETGRRLEGWALGLEKAAHGGAPQKKTGY